MRDFIDVYWDIEIVGQPTYIGTTGSYFAGFEYNDAHQYGKLFSQRFKLLLGHNVERDVTHLFTHIAAEETVMVQLMSNVIYLLFLFMMENSVPCMLNKASSVWLRVKQTAPLNSKD